MDTTRISENTIHLNELKADARRTQKSGLPFMMASVLIWTMIMLIQFADIKIGGKNMLTMSGTVTTQNSPSTTRSTRAAYSVHPVPIRQM